MKYYVTIAVPFEAQSEQEAIKLADKAMRTVGLVPFEIEGAESAETRRVSQEMAEDVPT